MQLGFVAAAALEKVVADRSQLSAELEAERKSAEATESALLDKLSELQVCYS